MTTYEQKIEEFARGKRLLRLAKPVRDCADGFCDACGSTQPRTLYALKDEKVDRHYFVGDNCQRELARRGVVLGSEAWRGFPSGLAGSIRAIDEGVPHDPPRKPGRQRRPPRRRSEGEVASGSGRPPC